MHRGSILLYSTWNAVMDGHVICTMLNISESNTVVIHKCVFPSIDAYIKVSDGKVFNKSHETLTRNSYYKTDWMTMRVQIVSNIVFKPPQKSKCQYVFISYTKSVLLNNCDKSWLINPFPHVNSFWLFCSREYVITLWHNKKLFMMSNFVCCHNVFNLISLSFLKMFNIFSKTISMSSAADFFVCEKGIIYLLCLDHRSAACFAGRDLDPNCLHLSS